MYLPAEMMDERDIKVLSIDALEIAECNLLMAIQGVRPEDVNQQIFPEINPITWILGHCADHMDSVFGYWCQGKRLFSEDHHYLFSYGAAKGIINERLPLQFGEIVNIYLRISDSSFKFLKEQPLEAYHQIPGDPTHRQESLMQVIQRVALHYMGHMGQILVIRRALGNPGGTFVSGMDEESRTKVTTDWNAWWAVNKVKF